MTTGPDGSTGSGGPSGPPPGAAGPHPSVPPPSGGPGQPAQPAVTSLPPWVQRALIGNWAGAATVAGAMVATAILLGVVLALLGMVEGQSFWQILVVGVSLAAGAFGADVTASQYGQGGSLGAFPLTITIASLAVAVWLFRSVTRSYPNSLDAILDAVRVALISALAMMICALIFHTEVDRVDVGPDAAGAFFLTLLVTFCALNVAIGMRRDWLHSRIAQVVHDWAVAPLWGFTALVVCLPVAGIVAALAALVFGDGGGNLEGSLSDSVPGGIGLRHEAAVAIAFAGNSGLWAMTLGSLGQLGVFGFDQIAGYLHFGREDMSGGLLFVTGDLELPGLWICLALAPLLLLAGLYGVIRKSGHSAGHRGGTPVSGVPLRSLGLWVASLLVVFPYLARLANVHVGVDAGPMVDSGGAGILGGGATFLVTLYALILGFVLALVTGVLDRRTLQQLLGSLNRTPAAAGPAPAGPPPPPGPPPAGPPPEGPTQGPPPDPQR